MEQASKRDEGSCVLDRRGGMKRKGKKACRQGGEGRDDGCWRRLYSFTRSFIVRTPPRGPTKRPLAHSELTTRSLCMYMFSFFFFFLDRKSVV